MADRHTAQSDAIKFTYTVNVVGVTFENRQAILEELAELPKSHITIKIKHEPTNEYDRNARKVIAIVRGLVFEVGYLSKDIVRDIISTTGTNSFELTADLVEVIKPYKEGANYGMKIKIHWQKKEIRTRGSAKPKKVI